MADLQEQIRDSEHAALIDACRAYDSVVIALLDWIDKHAHYGDSVPSRNHRSAVLAELNKARWLSQEIVARHPNSKT